MKPSGAISLLIIAVLGYGCGTTGGGFGTKTMIQPGERPALSSDEAGLWMAMDKNEQNLKTSGRVVKDPNLNSYVRGVFCRLTPDYCADIRLYIVNKSGFNASMAPNGVMVVWTGTLLRTENEAQLAFVLGHETAHYLQRHSLQQWRDARTKLDALVFVQLAAIVGGAYAGAPGVGRTAGQLIGLIVKGSIFAFSRDQEREADRLGLEMMVKAGYDPSEAPRIWEALIKERDAEDNSRPLIFFSNHPTGEERIDNLTSQTQSFTSLNEDSFVGHEKFQDVLGPWRAKFLREELHQREFARTQVLLDQLIKRGFGLGELHFFQGELYRLRGEDEDTQKAIAAYRKAEDTSNPPPETYRSLGLLLSRIDNVVGARLAFERYLQVRPDAEDRKMVKSYISGLKFGTLRPKEEQKEVTSKALAPPTRPEVTSAPLPKPVDPEVKPVTIDFRLKKLKDLRQKNLITEEDYQEAKKKVIMRLIK